ncbi:MAG: hypothetical protein ABFC77_01770 [Thermoguttaceae bacterium]
MVDRQLAFADVTKDLIGFIPNSRVKTTASIAATNGKSTMKTTQWPMKLGNAIFARSMAPLPRH